MLERKTSESTKTAVCAVALTAVSAVFMWLGLHMSPLSGEAVEFYGVIEGSVLEIAGKLSECTMPDMAMFLLLSLTSKGIRYAVSAVTVAVRGASLGIAAGFCAENAVPTVSVAMIVSYAMITALAVFYTVMLNRCESEKRVISAVYFLVTGAAVLLRILPLLFI